MTAYEQVCTLRRTLNKFKILSWVVAGGVDIQYERHQRKDLLDILNAINLDNVGVNITMIDKGRIMFMNVNRIANQLITISHR